MSGFDGVENQTIDHLDGPDGPRDPRSLLSSCFPINLKFIDVCYRVKIHQKSDESSTIRRWLNPRCQPSDQAGPTPPRVEERTILRGVTGMVSPGEMLAILGPSGSGKSTLLNAVAGRLHAPGLTGTILANDRKPTRQISKRTGFVAQDDLLYPHLTVRETLVFCSLLRLPKTVTKHEKIKLVESVMTELGLDKCENTIIGNSFIRGISGGERKRVSIAHEMLINPSLLVLDEPTSGLDATAAHRLVQTLAGLARNKGKTVVTSVHQPSSRVYQMFDSVLMLSEGSCLYFGKGKDAVGYFESVGFSPSFPMNPADFLLDLANGVCHIDGVTEREKPNVRQTLVASYNTLLAPKVKTACLASTVPLLPPQETSHLTVTRDQCLNRRTDLTTWFNQFCILLHRLLKERRHESFDTLRVFQVIAGALLAGLMWWRSDYRNVQDRLGLLFFISVFWGVLPSFNAVFTFPQERAIFLKERASGMYTLSSYFMSHILGSLSMELILPTVFLTLTYWMVGLRPGLVAFLLSLAVLLLYVMVSQGLGLALGAAIMDAKKASTVVTVTMLAFVLTGGYYVHEVPSCVSWIKYLSTTFYCYRLLINAQYGQGERISKVLGCGQERHMRSDGCKFVEDDVVGQMSPWTSASVMLLMFVGYRLLAYLALRRLKL